MNITIRPLAEQDLREADRIFRLAFGTFLNLPDPMSFAGDADFVFSRWRAAPDATLGAFDGDRLIGSNFAARWGSFGFFGPLTTHPELSNKGIAKRLLVETMALFDRWGVRQTGLYTFGDRPKHVALYRKFGFTRHEATAIMTRPVGSAEAPQWTTVSAAAPGGCPALLDRLAALTTEILPGLDLRHEIQAVETQRLGETVLLGDCGVAGFAVCHIGAATEAGSDTLYVKFAAVPPGPDASRQLDDLLAATEALAATRGLKQIVVGTNLARTGAREVLDARGYATMIQGVAMQRPDAPGFNRPDCFVLDDWR